MVFKTVFRNRIGTNESVYGDSPIGKLEKSRVVKTMRIPLQQGFEGNRQTRLSVGVDDLPALAFEQTVVGGMPVPNSTAVGTPFARVPTINYVQINVTVETTLFENHPEFIKRDSHYGFVEPFSLRLKSRKFLDGNVGVEFNCEFDDFPNYLTEVGFDKVLFSTLQSFQFLFGIQTSEQSPPFHQFLPFDPNVFSEIGLIKNLAFWRQNGNCKVFGVNVNSQNVLSLRNFLFLGKKSDDLLVGSQTECLANPTILNEGIEPLEIPVLFDWNCDSFLRIEPKFNKESALRSEGFAVSWNVELDSQSIDFSDFFSFGFFDSNDIPFDVANDLAVETGGFLGN